jgi:phenylacetate-CoA ligase
MKSTIRQLKVFIDIRSHFRLPREKLSAYQNHCLRRLVFHAYHRVPYYRKLFDQNDIKPDHIRGVSDLPAIPMTEKKDLRTLPVADVLARDMDSDQLLTFTTSGSTGEPFTIRRTPMEQRILHKLRVRGQRQMGGRILDSIAIIARVLSTDDKMLPMILRMLHRLDPRRRMQINALLRMDEIRQQLRHFQPDVVVGYASTLTSLAKQLTNEDRKKIRPRFVQTDSEMLTTSMREQIERGFAAPVFEVYDTYEFNMLAWQCRTTGALHVCDDGVILEVLKNGQPAKAGEKGEVVATCLHSYAMPLIRFRLGDIVIKGTETCSCGLPFSTIRSVQGRSIEYFSLPDGRRLHPYEILKKLKLAKATWVRQYQLIQKKKDHIVLRIVPLKTPSPEILNQLQKAAEPLLGPDMAFQVQLVSNIQREPSGKFQVFKSRVNN